MNLLMNLPEVWNLREVVSRAEDVGRLNAAILQLAVQGRLVAQDPADEPAGELLKRIAAEKKRLGIKSQPLPEIGEEERPFPLPDGWEWTRTEVICSYIQRGRSPRYSDTEIFPVISQKCVQWTGLDLGRARFIDPLTIANYQDERVIQVDDLLWNSTGVGTLGRINVVDNSINAYEKVVADSHVTVVRPIKEYVSSQYLYLWFSSPFVQQEIDSLSTGSTKQTELGTTTVKQHLVPIPPLAEQKRIVARVEALLAQTRQLEATMTTAVQTLSNLHNAAIQELLTAVDPDDFAAKWQFIADNFDVLYDETYPETAVANVTALKQAILQLAVQGKLTRQDPADEPAGDLLKRIAAEKKRLGIKSKKLAEIGEGERPYVLPSGWEWAKFGEIADTVSGVTKGRNLSKHKTISLPYLRVANVQRGYLDLGLMKEIVAKEEELEKYHLEDGDLLLTEGGDADKLGRSAIWRGEVPNCIHQNHVYRARPFLRELKAEWLMLYTNSPSGREYFLGASKQTTNLASINMTQLRNCPIPIPPLAEQHRIVARVDALLRLCDDLSAHITAAQATRAALRDAALAM